MERLTQLYARWRGQEPKQVKQIHGSGSNRAYYRLLDDCGGSVIGVVGTSREENHAFIYLSRHFAERGLPVPEVIAVSDDELCYLQTDLCTTSLFDALKHGREQGGQYLEEEKRLLKKTICALPDVQMKGAEGLDWSNCYPMAELDETGVMFDFNYFKYCFLKPSGVDFHEMRLEQDFHRMAKDLLQDATKGFMYRDFQARNVMIDANGAPSFIDYQGGRRGPFYYDVASFLWQASAKYPQSLRDELIEDYREALARYIAVPEKEEFRSRLNLFVLFRTMQVLGAYGYRGWFERKRHFIDSIPPAMENLRNTIRTGVASPYSYLSEVLQTLLEKHDERTAKSCQKQHDGLVVRVFSFSYKKGIPADESGNGGGYVFDCRSTHNPGRYEQYKKMTGLDAPVIDFLERDGEILTFLESVYRLADAHVERYLQRGFTDLMFSFGCTGGQHRSVYSAQHLAEHLNEKYGIEVRLCHREQAIEQTLEAHRATE